MHFVPVEGTLVALNSLIDAIRGEFVVVELVLYGIGHILGKGVKTASGLVVHLWPIEAPSILVIFPSQIVLTIGINASAKWVLSSKLELGLFPPMLQNLNKYGLEFLLEISTTPVPFFTLYE